MERILIVDDEKSIRLTLRAFLEKDGYEIHTAQDVSEAISLIEKYSFSVVISDIIMPQEDGINLLHKLKLLCPKIQVIIITGQPTLNTAIESVQAEAFDYLIKPVNGNEIRRVVSKAALVSRLNTDVDILEKQNKNSYPY